MKFNITSLKEILSFVQDYTIIDDEQYYKRCRVQLHAKGVVIRDIVQGWEIKTKRQQVCKSNQFIVAEIDAKVGGIGMIPPELDGSIVSSHYFLFNLDTNKIDPKFLDYYSRTRLFRSQITAKGSTNYASIRAKDVLDYTIPLPDIATQKQIIHDADIFYSKIKELGIAKKRTRSFTNSLGDAFFRKIIERGKKNQNWESKPLSIYCDINPPRQKIAIDDSELVTFVPMKSIDERKGIISDPEARPYYEVNKGFKQFIEGDVLFARITPCMQNGKSAIGLNLYNGIGFGSTEFIILRPNQKILNTYLLLLLRQKEFKNDAERNYKGTAGQQRVPEQFVREKIVTVPPIEEQKEITKKMYELNSKIEELSYLQSKSEEYLKKLADIYLENIYKLQ